MAADGLEPNSNLESKVKATGRDPRCFCVVHVHYT